MAQADAAALAAQTGDDTPLEMWLLMLLAASGCICAAGFWSGRRRRNR